MNNADQEKYGIRKKIYILIIEATDITKQPSDKIAKTLHP
jgi:hypothetical protein